MLHEQPANCLRFVHRGSRDIADDGHSGGPDYHALQRIAHSLASRFQQRRMIRCTDGKRNSTLCALLLCKLGGSFQCCVFSRDHYLPGRIVIRDHNHAGACGLFHRLYCLIQFNPDQGGHSAGSHRSSSLHRLSPCANQPCGVCQGESSRCAERRIFAQRMTGHKPCVT